MKKLLLLFGLLLVLTSCRDSTIAQYSALGDDCKIELVNCDGSITHTWYSSGKVATEEASDGFYFQDKSTGLLTRVSGNIIITIDNSPKNITITPIIK